MEQKIPEFRLRSAESPIICSKCEEETRFALADLDSPDYDPDYMLCSDCFKAQHSGYDEALDSFSAALTVAAEDRETRMTTALMDELYGKKEE